MKVVLLLCLGVLGLTGCVSHSPRENAVVAYTVRLKPKQDLKRELERVARELNLKAATIVSGVGSLEQVSLRLADEQKSTIFKGPHEIVSLTGTLSKESMHVHLAASDSQGVTIGGHLVEGNLIYTTCELVLLEQTSVIYSRETDATYGYKELVVLPRETDGSVAR